MEDKVLAVTILVRAAAAKLATEEFLATPIQIEDRNTERRLIVFKSHTATSLLHTATSLRSRCKLCQSQLTQRQNKHSQSDLPKVKSTTLTTQPIFIP
ncbi:hypothetical protein BDR26DRAFT_575155 [Obelidium mucronatum]|nr:hypothetical protein BDR26DRAFT_575155 [Obelidium mucronatum]